MYLKIASLLYKPDLISRLLALALTLICMYFLGGKGYWDCSGKPCWLWVCHRQRGESLRCCFICIFIVFDTLPCPGTNFPRQKDSLQPARQKWSEEDSGTYNWRKVHPSKLAWLNVNFSIISDSIETPLIATEASPHTMADLVAEGGGSRQKGIHILKVSTHGFVAGPKYSAASLKRKLFSQSCTAMSASTLARKGRRMDILIRYFFVSSIWLTFWLSCNFNLGIFFLRQNIC